MADPPVSSQSVAAALQVLPSVKDVQENLERDLEAFLEACKNADVPNSKEALVQLRNSILLNGIPDDPSTPDEYDVPARLTLRGRIWKALLGVDSVDAKEYVALIELGSSVKYDKIRGDSFRTFPNEAMFKQRVSEQSLVRLLNCFTHKYGPHQSTGPPSPFSYLQGMNAISAPFLYCMPELDAFTCVSKLIIEKFPLYWLNDTAGASAGCKLVDQIIEAADIDLHKHLHEHGLKDAVVYAYPFVSSLSAAAPPFSELIELWDFLMAFGVHLSVVCVAAQIILLREQLLATDSPKTILDYRKWPQLRAKAVVSMAMSILATLRKELLMDIAQHCTVPSVAARLCGRQVNYSPYVPPPIG